MNHVLLAQKVKAEEEFRQQKYLNEKMKKQSSNAKLSYLDVVGMQRLDSNESVIGNNEVTYQKLKNKINYADASDSYLTRGKELITRKIE